MLDTWAQLSNGAEEIWGWIASLPHGHCYCAESVHLHQVGNLVNQSPCGPFTRVTIVYKVGLRGAWHILRAIPAGADLHDAAYKHNWKLPVWNERWTMPTAPLQHFCADDFTLDQITGAMQRIHQGRLDPHDFYNVELQRILCHVVDAHRPGRGDAFERRRADLQATLLTTTFAGAGERAMLQFIARHWGKDVLDQMQVEEPTPQDYIDYARRHGVDIPVPSVFFRVSLLDAPATKLAHLDLPDWISRILTLQRVRMFQENYNRNPRKLYTDQLVYMYKAFESLPVEIEPLHRKRQRYTLPTTTATGSGYVGDIEALASTAAPCMRRLLNSDAFPKDRHRNSLVRNALAGNVPTDVIEQALVTLHRREDGVSITREDTLKRWNFEAQFEKQYAPDISCNIPNTDQMHPHLEELCPFEGSSAAQRCKQCHEQLYKEHPRVKPAQGDYKTMAKHVQQYWAPKTWWEILLPH